MIEITDKKMLLKVKRALRQNDDLYDLYDIETALSTGEMQSHTADDTWVVTQVFDYPRKRVVNVLFVVGDLGGAYKTDAVVENWARNIGATVMTATGRDGWEKHLGPGWMKVGTVYSKDLTHGRQ
jgi:hypothetical protein